MPSHDRCYCYDCCYCIHLSVVAVVANVIVLFVPLSSLLDVVVVPTAVANAIVAANVSDSASV